LAFFCREPHIVTLKGSVSSSLKENRAVHA
jgi:hypothetical protein